MLFQELIEQHHIHRFVTDGVDVALGVMGHQVRIHLRYLLSDEAELRDTQLVQLRLVMEGDGPQGQERLTGSGHISDVGFETARGKKHAQLAVIIHVTRASTRPDCLTRDAGDVGGCLDTRGPDTDGSALSGDSWVADVNVMIAGGKKGASLQTDGDVSTTARVGEERVVTDGGIEKAGGVAPERGRTEGTVGRPDGV